MSSLLALFLNLISLILMTVCAAVLIQHSINNKMAKCFSACQLLIINWIVCHLIDIFTNSLTVKIIFGNMGYVSVCSVGAVFLLFSLYYIKADIAESRLFITLLFLPSLILYVLEITDPVFHLFFESYTLSEVSEGVGFYITAAYNYALLLVSICLMLFKNIKNFREKLPQIILISLSAVIPLLLNLFSLLNLFGLEYDLTPLSFSASSVLIFFAVYRYEFISVSPFTVSHLMSSISEAVLIADKRGKVTYFNDTMKNAFSLDEVCIYRDISFAAAQIAERLSEGCEELHRLFTVEGSSGATVRQADGRYFSISRLEVLHGKRVISSVFIFTDVTEYYNFTNRLAEKNKELEKMNAVEKSLAVEKERTRIAQELHDSLGHSLISVMTLLKLSRINPETSDKNVETALEISSGLLDEVRSCVSGIKNPSASARNSCRQRHMPYTFNARALPSNFYKVKNSGGSLVSRIDGLLKNLYPSGGAELSVYGEESPCHSFASEAVFGIVREAVTNSARHSGADRLDVILKFSRENIRAYVIDNGGGCESITPGFGIKGMEEKARSAGGSIEFSSLKGSGFTVKTIIPVKTM